MKIQRIKLENFRSYSTLEIALDKRVTVIRGSNHAGKSTLEQAIQYALAARSEGTNANGAGYEDVLLRPGTDKATIILECSVEDEQSRIRTTVTRKSGRTIAAKDANNADITEDINKWLRANAEVISCLTNSRHFVDLDPAKQKDILSGIVLPATYDAWGVEPKLAAEQVGIDTSKWSTEHPFIVIGSTYDQAFEMRKNINRDLKNFISPSGEVSDAGDVEEIKEKLRTRRTELAAAQNKRAAMLSDALANKGKREATQARIDRAERMLAEETRSLTQHQAKILDKKSLKANKDAAAQSKLASELDTQIATLEIELKTLGAAIDKADALEDKCLTCEQTITDEVKTIIIKPLFDRKEAAKVELKGAQSKRAAIGDFTLAAQALRDHEAAEKEVTRTTERLEEAKAELAGANTDLEAIGEAKDVDTTEIDAEIANLTERIEKGTSVLTRMSAANERKSAYDAAVIKLAALKEKSALLEKLVAYFGPTGVQATLLQEHVGAFVESMNTVLKAWGYECSLTFEPSFFFGIVTTVADSDIRRAWGLRSLSKSERYRFAIAFQVALAMHTGFRFVVIDEMDMLDKEGRGGLMQQILSSDLDQAIVIGTDERDTISAGMGQAADYFMVSSALVDGIPTSSVARINAAV